MFCVLLLAGSIVCLLVASYIRKRHAMYFMSTLYAYLVKSERLTKTNLVRPDSNRPLVPDKLLKYSPIKTFLRLTGHSGNSN